MYIIMYISASSCYKEMSTRGMPIEQLVYSSLRESRQFSDSSAYNMFERWLANVETTLERENRTLLLAFDEFEKPHLS